MMKPLRRPLPLLAVAMLVGSLLILVSPRVAHAAGTPISQGRPTLASSTQNATQFPSSAAVDGSTTTRWSSAFSDPQWLRVDLGASLPIGSVTLNWEAAFARTFTIQVSDDGETGWRDITPVTAGKVGEQTLTVSATARFVRMNGLTRATAYGYSLWEFQVFAGAVNDPPPTCDLADAALNHPATASSTEGTRSAALAVDGNSSTRWGSAFAEPQWLRVDLGAVVNLCQVRLNWEAAYAKTFVVQISDDGVNNWRDASPVTAGKAGRQLLNATGTGRYVRMLGLTRATTFGFSLWDFSVYPKSGSSTGTDDWPQIGGDAGHTGFNAGERHFSPANAPSLHEQRSFTTATGTVPVLAGGAVITIANTVNGSGLIAIDATTGATRFEGDPAKQYYRTPAVGGGRIFAGTTRGEVAALNGQTGALQWSTPVTGAQVLFSSPVVSGDTVYAEGTNDRDEAKVVALDSATGAVKWQQQFTNSAFTSPAVDGGRVFFNAGNAGTLNAMDAVTGAALWTATLNPQLQNSTMTPLAVDSRVFIDGTTLTAYDGATGRQLWQRTSATAAFNPPAYAGGLLYSVESRPDSQPILHAIDPATGADRWTRQPNLGPGGGIQPAIAGGVIFLNLGQMMALDATTGQTLWAGPTLPRQYATIAGNGSLVSLDQVTDTGTTATMRFFAV